MTTGIIWTATYGYGYDIFCFSYLIRYFQNNKQIPAFLSDVIQMYKKFSWRQPDPNAEPLFLHDLVLRIAICCSTLNWIERRATLQRKVPRGPHSKNEKLLRATIYKKNSQNKINLIKILSISDAIGPHKSNWRAACLRPLS